MDLLAGEVGVLELVARGSPLPQVLDALCRLVEQVCSGCFCSILIVAPDRERFQVGAGPSLPEAYNDMLEGKTIDAGYGPCSLSVVAKAPIVTADLARDPRWVGSTWLALMQQHGYASCWSMPIISAAATVSGVFAIYRREPVGPNHEEQALIDRFTKIAGIAIDRAQADEALKASESELRRAHAQLAEGQRLSKTGSFTWDVLADEHDWSAEIRRIFGFDPDVRVTLSMIRAAIHPDDLAQAERVIGGAAEGRDFRLVFRIVTSDGAVRYADVEGRRIEEIQDRPVFIGALRDVTENKLAEAALKASEAELRRANSYLTTAQQLSKTGSFTWDVKARDTVWSDEMYRIFEADRSADDVNQEVLKAVHPDDLDIVNSLLSRALGGENIDVEYRLVTASGALKHVHTVAHRIDPVTDRPVFVGALQDITERKLVEAELRRANVFLETAQRLSKTGSSIWNPVGSERQWSKEMYRILELDPETPAPWTLAQDMVHPEDRSIQDTLMQLAREGRDHEGEYRVVTASGAVKTLHIAAQPVDDGPLFVLAIQDVTERVAGEDALTRARTELAHVSRVTALGALTASIAHEVNQPLAGIVANASTCLRMLAADPPNIDGARATAQRTIRDANRAAEVIKRLRALFAGRPAGAEPVDLNEAAREVLALSSGELQSARVVLETAFADDLPTVLGDRVQLQQVILNLVVNAAHAMRTIDSRPRVLRISTAAGSGGQVLLAARDCGAGAAVDHLEALFNPFYTTKPDGMGVGLSVSRSIVEAHGGRLWASANDGPGLTFSFSIPVADAGVAGADAKDRAAS